MGQPTETTGTLLEDLENLSEVVNNQQDSNSDTQSDKAGNETETKASNEPECQEDTPATE